MGTQVHREDFWVRIWQVEVSKTLEVGGKAVTDDCRFPNEAPAIHASGGIIVRLEGRGGIAGGHASERLDFEPDVVIANTGCVAQMYERLEAVLKTRENRKIQGA